MCFFFLINPTLNLKVQLLKNLSITHHGVKGVKKIQKCLFVFQLTKKIEDAEKNGKAIERWIRDVSELHRAKPPPTVAYTRSVTPFYTTATTLVAHYSDPTSGFMNFC